MENAIEQIAATLAHEVKNPLSLVLANIDLLESRDCTVEHKNNYKTIRCELNRINEIIMQFLTITRTPNETFDLVYVIDILKKIAEKYTTTYTNISFTLTTKTEGPVLGSRDSLSILFHNIMKNAIEALEEVNALCKIDILLKEENNHVIIEIMDNGRGIPSEIHENITHSFFTTKPTGTGLGLGICQKVADDHSGRFKLMNAEKGCVAVVELPLAE